MDEPFYVRAGLESWRTGSNRALMKAGTMPLPVDVQNIPIYLCEQIRGEPFDTTRDFHTILPYAEYESRVLVVAAHYGSFSPSIRRAWAGGSRYSCSEPGLLAHACLATDIAATAMVLAFAFHYERGREGKWVRRGLLPGPYSDWHGAKVSALCSRPIACRIRNSMGSRRRGLVPLARIGFGFCIHRVVSRGQLEDSRNRHGGRLRVLRLRLECASQDHESRGQPPVT
jgi:hypothetical protein